VNASPEGVLSRNLSQYKEIHAQKGGAYGVSSNKRYAFLKRVLKEAAPSTILDYGCGNSRLCDRAAEDFGITGYRFDPAIPAHATIPSEALEGVDLLFCVHVLEHLDEPEIREALAQFQVLAKESYIEVPLRAARLILPNGENAHTTVKPRSWWLALFKEFFPSVREVPAMRRSELAVVTWPAEKKSPKTPKRPVPRANSATHRPVPYISTDHLKDLRGKSVAVVGRAASQSGTGEGSAVDSCDVVIRINTALPLSTNTGVDYGEKTSLVYTCHGRPGLRRKANREGIPAEPYDKAFRASLSSPDGYTPFTGTVAVFEVLRRGAARVFVTGMDLYAGPSATGRGGHLQLSHSNAHAFHDPNRDKALLKDLLTKEPERVTFGKVLERIILSPEPIEHFRGLTPPKTSLSHATSS
jgi:hypothetical protein